MTIDTTVSYILFLLAQLVFCFVALKAGPSVFSGVRNKSLRDIIIFWLFFVVIFIDVFPVFYWIDGHVCCGDCLKEAPSNGVKSLWDLTYYSVVTVSTTGYGDLVPEQFSRVLAVLEILLGTIMISTVLAKIINGNRQ